jgi:hypothetical protein
LGRATTRGGKATTPSAKWSRRGLAAAAVTWGVVSGLFGLLVIGIAFTHHVFGHWNPNILLVNPLTSVVGGFAVVAAREGKSLPFARYAAWTALVVAGVSLLVALAGLAGVFQQDNAEVVALAVPLNIGLAAALAMSGGPAARPKARRSGGLQPTRR